MTPELEYNITSTPSIGSLDDQSDSKSHKLTDGETAPNSEHGSIHHAENSNAFEAVAEGDVDYRTLTLWPTTVILIKSQLGLGILSIPAAFATLGLIPGIIILFVIFFLSTWGGYVIGTFKLNHREAMSFSDAGFIIGGRYGREIVGGSYLFILIASASAQLLGVSIGLNSISGGQTCSLIFVFAATISCALFAGIQTLQKVSFIGWGGTASILVAIFTLMIAIAVEGRPNLAPAAGPWDKDIHLIGSPGLNLGSAMTAISNILFAYGSTPVLLAICSEMKTPEKEYTKALVWSQSFVTVLYLGVGVTVYLLAGQYVSSPALGTAGPLMTKICYGIALPGLLATAAVLTHIAGKYLFVRILRNSKSLCSPTKIHYLVWYSSIIGCSLTSFILACAIPLFSPMIGLFGSSIGAFICFVIPAYMWLYDNWTQRYTNTSILYRSLFVFNVLLVLIGIFLSAAGSYGSILQIITELAAGSASQPFACADRSGI